MAIARSHCRSLTSVSIYNTVSAALLSHAAAYMYVVSAVAKAQKNTIVVMVNPGAVLTPWTDEVAAAVTMFMPGLEMGNAISDVLY